MQESINRSRIDTRSLDKKVVDGWMWWRKESCSAFAKLENRAHIVCALVSAHGPISPKSCLQAKGQSRKWIGHAATSVLTQTHTSLVAGRARSKDAEQAEQAEASDGVVLPEH